MTALETVPESVLRLFDGYDADDLVAPEGRDFLIERLLERGDAVDLRWLFAGPAPEPRTRAWLETHGGRRLSRRSRAFWALVLGAEPSKPAPLDEAIWNV